MKIRHNFTINNQNHVVLEDGTELALTHEEYMYTQLLQGYDLEILVAVDKFCKEHDITYYLAEGTLLGAIRNNGFIPWDDDIDICMFREDYDRFLEYASQDFPEGYAVDCDKTNPNHWTILSQVEMTRPVPHKKMRLEGIALYNGPCIDIFPLDYAKEDNEELRQRAEKIDRVRRAMWIKSGLHNRAWYKTFKKRKELYYPLKFYGMRKTLDDLREECFFLMKQDNSEKGQYTVNFASLYKIEKEIFPIEWFGTPRMVEFEGVMLPCPAESEKILTKIYANYQALPKISKRKNKHFFSEDEGLLEQVDDPESMQIITELKALRQNAAEEENIDIRPAQKDILAVRVLKKARRKIRREVKAIRTKAERNKKEKKRAQRSTEYNIRRETMRRLDEEDIKKKTVFFDAFSGLGILDSPRAIFKRMLEREEFSDYKYIWTVKDRNLVNDNVKEYEYLPNVTVVDRDGEEYLRAVATSEFLISNSSFPTFMTRKEGQRYLNTWHGIPIKVMGYERPGQRISATQNIVRNFLNATHLVSANDFTADTMYRKAYMLEGIYGGKLLDSPLPRTDALFNTDRDYVMNKLREAGIRTDKKIILYAPTWKGANYKDFDTDTEGLRTFVKTLRERIDTDKYEVFLRLHYFLDRKVRKDPELKEISIPFTIDTNELLSVTDVLISDYSSIFFDFLGTKRPVLFYIPDLDDYASNRGLYLPLEDLPGPVSKTIEGIADYIDELEVVSDQFQDKYDKMRKWCGFMENARATDLIIDGFFLDKEVPEIDLHSNKKKLLIMAEWVKDFAARNELENLIKRLDYDKYDVTLLAGKTASKNLIQILEELEPRVRILINDRKMNIEKDLRMEVYRKLKTGDISLNAAGKELKIDNEWHRLFGNATFDELLFLQPEAKAKALWLILAGCSPIEKKSLIVNGKGLTGAYSIDENVKDFNIFMTLDEYEKTLN